MVDNLLSRLGVNAHTATTGNHVINSPIDGSRIGAVTLEPASAVATKVAAAQQAFESWRSVPASLMACSTWCPAAPATSAAS